MWIVYAFGCLFSLILICDLCRLAVLVGMLCDLVCVAFGVVVAVLRVCFVCLFSCVAFAFIFDAVLCDLALYLVGATWCWFRLLVFVFWLFVIGYLWFVFDFG